MTKTFTVNKNKKIEFTRDELKELLDEVYKAGYNDGYYSTFTWTSLNPKWYSPYITNTTITNEWNDTTTSQKMVCPDTSPIQFSYNDLNDQLKINLEGSNNGI